MPPDSSQFSKALQKFDEANARDPRRVVVDGRAIAQELLYCQRMTQRLERIQPDASDALKLAVRGQHICRWMIPRKNYPMDRAGYHAWRTELGRFHAQKAGEILAQVGYDPAIIARVQ